MVVRDCEGREGARARGREGGVHLVVVKGETPSCLTCGGQRGLALMLITRREYVVGL